MIHSVVNSKGMTLGIGDGEMPEVFSTIGGITDMPNIAPTKSVKDRTSLGDSIRYYGHGIEEPPSFTLSIFWNPDDTQQSSLDDAYTNETEDNYQITCPDDSPSTTYTFKAIVTSRPSIPYGGIDADLMFDVAFQLVENDDGKVITRSVYDWLETVGDEYIRDTDDEIITVINL